MLLWPWGVIGIQAWGKGGRIPEPTGDVVPLYSGRFQEGAQKPLKFSGILNDSLGPLCCDYILGDSQNSPGTLKKPRFSSCFCGPGVPLGGKLGENI